MSDLYKPGEKNNPEGDYEEVGPRGGHVKDPREVHIDDGDKMPPTSKKGNKWEKKE